MLRSDRRPKVRVGPSDAEDLLQDTLLLFLEKHESIQPGSWRAWILGTLRNRELELFKKQALWKKYEPQLEAHAQHAGPWCAEPDAAIRQEQVLFALKWLLAQIHPSRRDVAERYLFDGVTLAAIAAETGSPLGTVRSQWTRARGDMRAAIERERAELDELFVAVMLAILGAWCVWIGAHVRRTAGVLAGVLGRPQPPSATRGSGTTRRWHPSSPRVARGRHDRGGHRWRRRAGVAFACALLPLVVLRHTPLDSLQPPGAATIAASFEASAGTFAGEMPHDTARSDEHLVLTPFLTTNAERELEWGSPPTALRAAPAPPAEDPDREIGRGLLGRANTALQQGHERVARDALRLYDEEFPDDPFPALRAQVASALVSRRSP